ncbi:hypothetical protein V6N12_007636 [Hibiscus sabdariffa]|uniref:Uncharacterized protein n=1 Tax=Hibiscus sabdariffa TaxID=183260 RepID=A0ABR2F2C8_9ROSI
MSGMKSNAPFHDPFMRQKREEADALTAFTMNTRICLDQAPLFVTAAAFSHRISESKTPIKHSQARHWGEMEKHIENTWG